MKRLEHLLLAGLLATLFTAALLAPTEQIVSAAPAAAIRYVAPGGNCGTAAPCYATVQAAVDSAVPGDTIKVAQGRYTGVSTRAGLNQVVYINKTVAVRGGYALSNWNTSNPVDHPATLDARGQGRVLVIVGSITPIIKELRITGGDAAGQGGDFRGDGGGGVYVITAKATLDQLTIFSNTAAYGGGVYLNRSDAHVTSSIIRGNGQDGGNGGGLYLYKSDGAVVSDNSIADNRSANGGGMTLNGCKNVLVEKNIIAANVARQEGGGIRLATTIATLRENLISGNQAAYGGGVSLFAYGQQPLFESNRIVFNSSTVRGGGVYFNYVSPAIFVNNIIDDNQSSAGSGLFIRDSSPQLIYTTIARNRGGSGVAISSESAFFDSDVTMTNTIISGHAVGIDVSAGNTVTLASTLWFGNVINRDGAGTINQSGDRNGNPRFAFDGYHLLPGSAAIDHAIDAGVSKDIDGDTRPYGAGYDIGADEFNGAMIRLKTLFLPVVLRNR